MEFQALFPIITTIKKTFFHHFFPTKTEEDVFKSAGVISHSSRRELIEIRDIHPPWAGNPWFVKKTLNPYEMTYGKMIISFNDMFDHVIRYWSLEMAYYLNVGHRVGVAVWDVTEEEQNHKMHYNKEVFVCMVDNGNGDFVLSCMELFRDRGLKVDDEICLGWDYGEGCFRVRVGRF